MKHVAARHLLLILLPAFFALGCEGIYARIGLPAAGGGLPVTVLIQQGVDPADVRVALDGDDVTGFFAAGAEGLVGTLPLPAPGTHELEIRQPQVVMFGQPLVHLTFRQRVDVPAAAPNLVGFDPAPVGGNVASTAWLRLRFDADVSPESLKGFGFSIACGGVPLSRVAYTVAGRNVLLDPKPGLPAGNCRVVWRGAAGALERNFTVAASTPTTPATATYDRTPGVPVLAPFPDDFWAVDDASTATGRRIDFETPTFGDARDGVLDAIQVSLARFDGWSPIGPIVVGFSHAVEPSLLPVDESGAMDPFAPLALFDVDPASPDYGARIPYRVEVRNDPAPDGTTDHLLLIFPSITLRTSGHYAVVVTRRLVASGDATRPFGASPFATLAAGPPSGADTTAIEKAREEMAPVLGFVETVPDVPMPREDVALALPFSTRSFLRDPSDIVAMKENAVVATPPVLTVETTTTTAARRLIVRGKIALPDYMGSPDGGALTRDPVTQRPQPWRDEPVPFVMSLPNQALAGPVPIVIYQHGSPGGPEDVLGSNNEFLDDAGYAIVGIQDTANRRYGANSAAQTGAVLVHLIVNGRIPLLEMNTHANLQYLVRALPTIAQTDWLPVGAPDGRPELDASKLLYRGISFGAHHSLGFLPFAPEITAAVSVVGGGRFYENTVHQIDYYGILGQIGAFLPTVRPIELIVGLAAIQNDEDLQDPHLLARHLYRERLPIAGIDPSAPPTSLLWLEGIGDNIVSNNATRAAARELGIPQVGNIRQRVPTLDQVPAPLSGNIAPNRTAGHYQYQPNLTPSCVAVNLMEGHHCPQRANEARQQILHFFSTALSGGAPQILDPLP